MRAAVTKRRRVMVQAVQAMTPSAGDAGVEMKAQRLLDESNYLALRRLQCEFRDGHLVLRGRVPTFYLKQMAQTLVRQLPQVQQIENRLDVAEFWN
jgi:osmotically-inducible protein OsmY